MKKSILSLMLLFFVYHTDSYTGVAGFLSKLRAQDPHAWFQVVCPGGNGMGAQPVYCVFYEADKEIK